MKEKNKINVMVNNEFTNHVLDTIEDYMGYKKEEAYLISSYNERKKEIFNKVTEFYEKNKHNGSCNISMDNILPEAILMQFYIWTDKEYPNYMFWNPEIEFNKTYPNGFKITCKMSEYENIGGIPIAQLSKTFDIPRHIQRSFHKHIVKVFKRV